MVSDSSFSFSSSAGAGGATRVNVSATKFLGLSLMVKPSVWRLAFGSLTENGKSFSYATEKLGKSEEIFSEIKENFSVLILKKF